MADRSPGWLARAGLATQRQPAPPNEATTRAIDGARMRKKVKAAVERAGTLQRRARAAQERAIARESKVRVQESRRLIEASKRTRGTSPRPPRRTRYERALC